MMRFQSLGRWERRGSNSSGHNHGGGGGAQVIQRTVWDVRGGAAYLMLTFTNYNNWVVMMKFMMEACGLWVAVDTGNAERHEDWWAMEAILLVVPLEMH